MRRGSLQCFIRSSSFPERILEATKHKLKSKEGTTGEFSGFVKLFTYSSNHGNCRKSTSDCSKPLTCRGKPAQGVTYFPYSPIAHKRVHVKKTFFLAEQTALAPSVVLDEETDPGA